MSSLDEKFNEETYDLLSRLIQNKCINPPGDEMRSIRTIEDFLKNKGIDCKVFESNKNRGNLVASIPGIDPKAPGLIFGPSHVDVVPVTKPEDWKEDPFGGAIINGEIWGRGALDMLFIVATQVQAFTKLHEEKFKPIGDLILFIVADEEAGGSEGAEWMIKYHSSELGFAERKMFAVTEAGGIQISKNKFVVITGEKGVTWLTLKFKGTPGHGSSPYLSDNAVHKASKAALYLTDYCDKKMPIETTYLKNLVKGLGINFLLRFLISSKRLLPFILKFLGKRDKERSKILHSLSRMTISPNIIQGGTKTNIIASEASLELDIRTLPGQNYDDVVYHIKKALKELSDEVEIVKSLTDEGITSIGTASPIESEFVSAMLRAVQRDFKDACIVPMIASGATDGRFFREKDVDSYGFSLFNPDTPLNDIVNLAHGVDERISLKTVDLSLNVYYNLAKEFLE
ncbi:MAG: M20/M25/M40 family metallo-hydrolase [Candidatus Heimdallarchaeota archaeon]|nr:M20/M25/M40 family metallo-hydrolase [Candidatus Heimdallarchaeota archaeon]